MTGLIIAIDPGLVTGIALYRTDPEEMFNSFEIGNRFEVYDWLSQILPQWRPEVVAESYKISQRTAQLSSQMDALYILGAIEMLCHAHGLTFSLQAPSTKSFGTDAKLKALDWWDSSRGGHKNDAARHLLYRLRQDPAIIARYKDVV